MITVTSTEFNHQRNAIKEKSDQEPVFITKHGRPAHVLLSIKDYKDLVHRSAKHQKRSVSSLLGLPVAATNSDIPIVRNSQFSREADLS